jgi:hypothetical protein
MGSKKHPTERSTYSPLINYANTKGFDAISEISWHNKLGILDLLIQYEKTKYILEIKMVTKKERHEKMIDGLIQAYGYARNENCSNIAVIIYDGKLRDEKVIDSSDLEKLSLETLAEVVVISKYWWTKEKITGRDFFDKLWLKINEKAEAEKVVELVADILSGQTRKLSHEIRKYFLKPTEIQQLAKEIGHTYDAFFALSNVPKTKEQDKKDIDAAIVDLLSNVILSQIIFYSIYERINKSIPKLPNKPMSINEIENCFDTIREIDYKPIYSIRALTLIPATKEILEILGKTIELLDPLRPDQIEHDLLGQLFVKVMPPKSQKTLAAFYSRPSASDILARLAIRYWDNTIWDVACGSGTILMSAYKTKRDLYRDRLSPANQDMKVMHKTFIEEQITGTDLMAFACVLSGLNLATQDITSKTDNVRIAKMDSLELPKLLKNKDLMLRSASSLVAEEISKHPRKQKVVEDFLEKNTITPITIENNGPHFSIGKVNVVLMNPPFTVKTNLKKEFLTNMKLYDYASKRCGHDVDLWGYFLAMAPELVLNGGIIGAIVPTGFLKGKHTQKIRDYYLNNFSIKYIVKPTNMDTLSGNANFRDMMLICENRKPIKNDKTTMVLLKSSLENLPSFNSKNIANEIEKLSLMGEGITENIEVRTIVRDELITFRKNLMPLLTPNEMNKIIIDFEKIIKQDEKLTHLSRNDFKYGIDLHKDYSKALYVQKLLPNRSLRGRIMGFKSLSNSKVIIVIQRGKLKGEEEEVPIYNFDYGVITSTGLTKLDITDNLDLIVKRPFNLVMEIASIYSLNLSQIKIKNEIGPDNKKATLFVVDRLNLNSDNSHLIAFYSTISAHSANSLYPIKTKNEDDAKILSLSLNSTISLFQICHLKSETQMNWGHLAKEDWLLTKQLNINKLTENERNELLVLFEQISRVSLPSIKKQLIEGNENRKAIDTLFLKILGFNSKKISEILPVLYQVTHTLITSMDNSL